MYEATGKIKEIFDTQTFPSGFTKREFVITTKDENYPQDIKFEIVKDKCSLLDDFIKGNDVTVSFDVRGNEYKGKYYVNLNCWKLKESAGDEDPRDHSNTNQGEPSAEELAGDDIPF